MFIVSENNKQALRAIAYVIERKLLEMQTLLIAHRHQMRFVHLAYVEQLTKEDTKEIEEAISRMYDLLEDFCATYSLQAEHLNLKNELRIKANFLWEDISGATAKSLRGHGELDEKLCEDYDQRINEMIDAVNDLINKFK